MYPIHWLTLILVITIPIAWIASEFQERRWLRIALGSTAIMVCFGVAFVVGALQMLNANAWYGHASKELIDAIVVELEAGNHEHVLECVKRLQKDFAPTYENRAQYDILVETAAIQIRRSNPPAEQP